MDHRKLLLFTTLLAVALWYIPGASIITYPIRLFVTLVHESGHALAALLTGGSVEQVTLAPDGSGFTLTRGGIVPLIYMAGYIGTALAGSSLLMISRNQRRAKKSLAGLGIFFLIVTLLWLLPGGPLGVLAGVLSGLALVGASRSLSESRTAFLLSFLAVQLSLNAVFDLRSLIFLTTQTNVENDAVFMARQFGLTPWFWALLWAGIGIAVLAGSVRAYWSGQRKSQGGLAAFRS